ncbi:hypothetical protein FGIG_09701 [Fasciola gigantica]|uniref:Uncharacterized protein n=1 Tax=Fasciola gigantica TaxID=46835 RepID=A0A504YTT1_FASGI|nr:hypothetical protein FGIG_09701 [Fasciola gigantica]
MRRHLHLPLACGSGFLVFVILWLYPGQYNLPQYQNELEQSRIVHEIERTLYKAYRQARSGNAKLLIAKSLRLVSRLQSDASTINLTGEKLYSQIYPINTTEVCPDYWKSPIPDKLWFQNAYQTKPCNRIPLKELVQIVLYTETCAEAYHLVQRIHTVYSDIQVYLAIKQASNSNVTCDKIRSNVIKFEAVESAMLWNRLVERVRSKYVLIGRNMVDFTPYTDLDRLLRVMHQLRVDIVGGSVRLEPDGRWYDGCYQTNVKNFTIRIQPGHDLSAISCAYCDYLASPFLIRRDFFLEKMKQSKLDGFLMPFVDLFLRLSHPLSVDGPRSGVAVACVDVLFHVVGHNSVRGLGVSEIGRDQWTKLARQWTVNRLVLPSRIDHRWTCDEVQINCHRFKRGGLMMPGCCLDELSRCSKAFLNLSAEHEVWTCIFSGNVMGSIKLLGAFLPWERDSDFGWDARKHAVIQGPIKAQLEQQHGCKMGPTEYYTSFKDDVDKCSKVTNTSCMYHPLKSANWRIQLYGEPNAVHRDFLHGLSNPTLINVDGMWTATYPNPGYVMRGLYGDNILGHIQHWLDYGLKDGWSRYTNVESAAPLPCPSDAPHHACYLGNYLPLGNLQFQDIIV